MPLQRGELWGLSVINRATPLYFLDERLVGAFFYLQSMQETKTPLNPLLLARGWREPGNMTLQRGRIFGLVLFKRRITDQGVGPAWQRQSGARAG